VNALMREPTRPARGSAHVDSFARDNLPPRGQWPELVFDLPELQFPERLNCAVEILDRNALGDNADRRAIAGADGGWSYRDLQQSANRIARVLTEDMRLVPGNRVLLRAPNNPMLAACWFAALKAGAIPVPTMPLLRAAELTQIVRKACISHALCDAGLATELEAARARCPSLQHLRYFNADGRDALERIAAGKPADFESVDTAADDVALITFTSGTTGVPKGTMHFHRDVVATCLGFPQHILRQSSDDVVLGTASLAFTYGLGGLLHFPLYHRASTVLIEQYTPETLLEAIARNRASVLYTGPTTYRAMSALARRYDLSSLRACVSAGEALPVPTRDAWEDASGVKLIDGIGASEMLYMFIAAAGDEIRPGATGKPIPGYRATVLDAEGQPVAPGTVGRLAVKGPTGCRYLADERQRDYVQHGWNFTGDAYLMDAEGYFYYQGRTDDMIVSAGYNIAPAEVEAALLSHPAVADCGVVGCGDAERGQIVKAFVALKPGQDGGAELVRALQDFVKRAIAPYKYPRAIEFVDALPRTETGKLQRFRLRQLCAAQPRSAGERKA